MRDRIPEIIEADGTVAVVRTLEDHDFREALKAKLTEEVAEVMAAIPAELGTELCDVLEVVLALAALSGITPQELESLRSSRAAERGCFASKLWLEETRPSLGAAQSE